MQDKIRRVCSQMVPALDPGKARLGLRHASSRRKFLSMTSGMAVIDIATVLGFAIKWAVYTALLWGMIKIQKLKYNTLGLFASSLVALLVEFIPFGGSYLSYVVLVIGLWKCTNADIAPDCIFTVCIAGALMFCFNLWVIGLLLGPLRPDLAKPAANGDTAEMVDDEEAAEDSGGDTPPAGPAKPASRPTLVASNSVRAAARPVTSPSAAAPATGPEVDAGFLIPKGVSYGASPSALISDGTKVYTVSRGEWFTVNLPRGRARFHCEDVTKTNVILKNAEGQLLNLKLR